MSSHGLRWSKTISKCGCEDVTRYDIADRTLCTTVVGGSFRPIGVQVKRFECSGHGNVFEGESPFYDRCNNGAPIVDLCLALAASNLFNGVESILMQYGIQVDKDKIRSYAMRFRDKEMNHAGIPVMDDAKIGLNVLKVQQIFSSTLSQLKGFWVFSSLVMAGLGNGTMHKGICDLFDLEELDLIRLKINT